MLPELVEACVSMRGLLLWKVSCLFLRLRSASASAFLILLQSSLSLATSSETYSATVFQPNSDLSAIRMSLMRFSSSFFADEIEDKAASEWLFERDVSADFKSSSNLKE